MKNSKNNHTQNSLLCTIAGIHGCFLSIICGILFAFYMYNYQQSETCKLQLDDLRLKVARMMTISGFYDPSEPDAQSYFDANGLDIDKIMKAFYEQIGHNPDPKTEAILSASGLDISQVYAYKQRVKRLLNLINVVANIYPYSTRSRKASPGLTSMMYSDLRKDWTREWQRDLGKLNHQLMLLLKQKRAAVEDLLRRYDETRLRDEMARRKNSSANEYDLHKILGNTFRDTIERFFATVEMINRDIVPELNDHSFKLTRFQTNLMDKSTILNALVPLALILLFGVVAPLVWALKPVYSIIKTVSTLVLPLLLYIWLLIFLLRHLN